MKSAIDLYSGCGGMTYGLKKAGFAVLGALELDPIASATYKLNHPKTPVKEIDIRELDAKEWMQELGLARGELDLMAGCPPCQGFSRLRTLNGIRKNTDPRNQLVLEMIRLIEEFRPKAVLMENVPGLANENVFQKFLSSLNQMEYIPKWDVLNACDYGVPQRRKRLVLIAGYKCIIPFGNKSSKVKTVKSAIEGLKPAGKSGDYLHDMPENRTNAMKKWIAAVPKDGGSRKDLPDHLQRPCHIRSNGFKDVYGRMAWKKPAPTLTSGCCNPSKGRFLHPEENRNITMREAALLQSFPNSFKVPPGTTKTNAALMIGNALPPEFVRRHASEIRNKLDFVLANESEEVA